MVNDCKNPNAILFNGCEISNKVSQRRLVPSPVASMKEGWVWYKKPYSAENNFSTETFSLRCVINTPQFRHPTKYIGNALIVIASVMMSLDLFVGFYQVQIEQQ